ncbi:MAG: hypothetical protein CBC82_02285 [Cellvibrionales bacterium TMED122]|nr:MAG: hypothetical protein CBC82_02285 [Cellvibrionales bacterium TMED122]
MTETLQRVERRFKAMGGPCRVVIDSTAEGAFAWLDGLFAEVEQLVAALEQRYSRYRDDSLVSLINRRAGSPQRTKIDEETIALLGLAEALWETTGGLFDITSGPLRRAWDFRSVGPARPECIEAARDLIGWEHLDWQGPYLRLPLKGMELDFGGIVKEYAVDCVAKRLRDAGVLSGMVDLAGDIAVIGDQADGSPWQISIRDPFNEGSICTVNLTDAAIATSGSYERRITYQGKDYGHLLDPETGWPVRGPASVTVIDAHCLTAGAVATTACLQTEEKAASWLTDAQLPWLMVDRKTEISGPISSDSVSVV